MKVLHLYVLIASLLGSFAATAQEYLPVDEAFQQAVLSQTRTLTGMPGRAYWQNKADYAIDVQYDPSTLLVKGSVEIAYVNNSPDTLEEIWFKLYPNLYRKGVEYNGDLRIAKSDRGVGVQVESFQVDGKSADAVQYQIDGTNMVLVPLSPLLPGKRMHFKIAYHYVLNAGSHNRTGKVDDGTAFIAYFFPRVAVYDDIDGWNKYPYRGSEEFYNDFCDFDVSVTVPNGFVVWATGNLVNAKEVFRSAVVERLQQAELQDEVIEVISATDLKNKAVSKGEKAHTFRYKAEHVVDFALGLSDRYVWKSASLVVDSASGRRTRVDAVFHPNHHDYDEVVDFARKTVYGMSYVFPKWPFPYPHITIFDGLDQMEYPMMANDNPTKSREDGITLTSHEVFHTMFPFYMGTNETKFAWMDEGWATIGEWELSRFIDTSYVDHYGIVPTAATSGTKDDSPIMTLTTDLRGAGSFTNSYPKPAFGYLFVKEYLGDSLFYRGLHHYIRTWQGKHPQPLDFFHCMNQGSGKDLNWFWRRWFYSEGVIDLAIHQVSKTSDGYKIVIENKSIKPLPVHLAFTYEDGTITHRRYSIALWESGCDKVNLELKTDKLLQKVDLGSTYVPDKNKKDNVYILK